MESPVTTTDVPGAHSRTSTADAHEQYLLTMRLLRIRQLSRRDVRDKLAEIIAKREARRLW